MSMSLFSNTRLRRILLMVLFSFLFILGVLSYLFYNFSLKNFEQSELMKLKGISNAVSLQITGDEHAALVEKFKNKDDITGIDQDSLYKKIHEILKINADANMLKSPIYTLIKSPSGDHYLFAVTSQNKPYYKHVYKSFPASLIEMYAVGGMLQPYKDEFGQWLSAFSTIKNSKNETVALLMVDEDLNSFNNKAKTQTLEAILYALLAFLLMYIPLILILTQILNKENNDKILLSESNDKNRFMKDQLEILNGKLNEINELRKEMIANISHDLRTPLTSTIGYLDLLKEAKSSPAENKSYLDIAHSEAMRLRNMVSDLFELSKLETNQVQLNKEPFLIADLAVDIFQKYKYQLEAKHVELQTDFQDVGLAYGDIKYIDRLFQNLMDNAVRYVYEGGFIKLSILDANDHIKVKLCNLGDPIEAGVRPHIFDRYYKSGNQSGSGLGLAIAKKICDLHNCDIDLDVTDNVNSFWFTLEKYKVEN